MEKRKVVSLTGYVTRILLIAFLGIITIGSAAIVTFLLLLQINILSPANAGEAAARSELDRLKQADSFSGKLQSDFYDYIYFTPDGKVSSSSLKGKELKKAVVRYSKLDSNYSNGTYTFFRDGSYCLFMWQYKVQFTNQKLRQRIANPGLLFLLLTILALLLFFILFIHSVGKRLQRKIALVETASQQIAQQNLDAQITTNAGIREFNEALQSMEDMRAALKDSLVKQWENQQQRKQEITALAHDIKTPLTVINGNAELLLEDPLNTEQKQLAMAIHNSGLKAKKYVGALQQVSNFDILSEEKAELSIAALLNEVKLDLAPLAKAKLVSIAYNYESDGTLFVSDFMLTRALVAIGENAIHYTAEGEIQIYVKRSKATTAFVFEDNGPGFSKEALMHANEMFWQHNKSRSTDNNYGIGLALAEKVAQQHQGELILENAESGGAKVTLVVANVQ